MDMYGDLLILQESVKEMKKAIKRLKKKARGPDVIRTAVPPATWAHIYNTTVPFGKVEDPKDFK